jgi:hypothetical protein
VHNATAGRKIEIGTFSVASDTLTPASRRLRSGTISA